MKRPKEQNKICNLCGMKIETKKERYTHVEDYDKEKIVGEIWCHIVCFKKSMNRNLTELEKKAGNMLQVAGKIFNKIAPELEITGEEYEIR